MMEYLDFKTLSTSEAVLRVGLAALFGLVLGLEREMKDKPIDFRAYMIVAVISCVIALMSLEIHATFNEPDTNLQFDFMRTIEGVLTGIGFLGAGAIIRSRDNERVQGTATGAAIWGSGGLGLTIGYGFYGLAVLAFFVMAVTLFFLGIFRPNRDKAE